MYVTHHGPHEPNQLDCGFDTPLHSRTDINTNRIRFADNEANRNPAITRKIIIHSCNTVIKNLLTRYSADIQTMTQRQCNDRRKTVRFFTNYQALKNGTGQILTRSFSYRNDMFNFDEDTMTCVQWPTLLNVNE